MSDLLRLTGSALYRRLSGELSLALARTFIARGIAALGSFILVVVLGRLYGAPGVGVFALAESLIMAIATLSRYGMDNAVMRFVGRDLQSPHVYFYMRYACTKALLLSVVASGALYLSRGLLAQLFHAPALPPVLVGIAIAAPAFTLTFICSGFMKAIRKPATACLLQKGAVALLAAIAILLLQIYILPDIALANIGIAYAAAAWLIFGMSAWFCRRWFRNRQSKTFEALAKTEIGAFDRSSSAFFAANLARFMIDVVGIWIAGYMLSNSELGLFKAAQQVALLIGFVLTVINAIYPPRFAALYHQRSWLSLNRLARQSALLGLVLAIVPVALCFIVPTRILSLVGDGFTQAVLPLYVLATAQLIHVASGSVGFLLNMVGYELLVRNYAWITNIFGIVAIVVLTPIWGALGVAVGVAAAIVTQNFTGTYFAWRRVGIWMPPGPNILQFAGLNARARWGN